MSILIRCNKEYLEEAKYKIKLVVFDLDGTLTMIDSVWRYIHEKFGVWDKAKKHKEMFFNRKITYEEWAKLDAELWRGRKEEEFLSIINRVPLMDHAKETLQYLTSKYKVIILSSGLDILKHRLQNSKVDKFISNTLIFKNKEFTGEIKVQVKFDNKDKILENILKEYKMGFENVAAIGDALNDVNMLKKAKLSIAINPKNKEVEEISHIIIRGKTLKPLQYIL